MPPREPSCLDIIFQAIDAAKQLQASDDFENKAAQRAPYDLVGIRWINKMFYLEAEFEETVIGQKRFLDLTKSLPEHTWVQWKVAAVPVGVEWQSVFAEPTLRVKWRSASFKINEIDPSKALRLLQSRRLHQQMSCRPFPERLLYWVTCENYDIIIVDGIRSRLDRDRKHELGMIIWDVLACVHFVRTRLYDIVFVLPCRPDHRRALDQK